MVRYYIEVLNVNGIVSVDFKNRKNVSLIRQDMEETPDGCDGYTEYYAEYNDLGVFIYVKDNLINKEKTFVQDMKNYEYYTPKISITYL